MCGIFGVWEYGGRSADADAVGRATRRLRHRGPDDEGYLFADTRTGRRTLCGGPDTDAALNLPPLAGLEGGPFDLAFGFRRLSILDLSPAGHQPMSSADGACWLIFNGEVYNYVELKSELAALGHPFRTGTDTEVILAAYQEWGEECVKRFTGMWAFALWDARARRLLLARDPFGIKPLYYTTEGDRLAFASEIKALLGYTGAARRAHPARLYEYLRSGLTDYGDGTLFEGIRQLPAAHYLVVRADDPTAARPVRYWQIDFTRELDLSFDEAAARLRELFLTSVRLHLRSDVRVGAALSGGIDSSAIVASMRAVDPNLDVHAFSYVAEDEALSEERWVDLVGASSRAVVHKVRPTPEELVTDLDALVAAQDEPFGSTSIYAQHRVFRLAREAGVTVMLDGQGADELLAGYRIYLAMRMASLLRRGRFVAANRFLRETAALPGNGLTGLNLLANAGGVLLPERFSAIRKLYKKSAGNGADAAWLDEGWFAERGVAPRRAHKPRTRLMLQEQLYETLTETSLPMLLRYEDRNSMAHSIESRVPFLTTGLAEFVLALPEEHIVAPDGTSKSVFRRAMRGIVPDEILDRRDKIGFATPERRWMETLRPWVERVLGGEAAARIPGLNIETVKQQWAAMLAGRQAFDFRVWRWLNVIRWAERYEVSF
jgi:asparagine synthase (glutamine-hydrolysing)